MSFYYYYFVLSFGSDSGASIYLLLFFIDPISPSFHLLLCKLGIVVVILLKATNRFSDHIQWLYNMSKLNCLSQNALLKYSIGSRGYREDSIQSRREEGGQEPICRIHILLLSADFPPWCSSKLTYSCSWLPPWSSSSCLRSWPGGCLCVCVQHLGQGQRLLQDTYLKVLRQ